MKPSLTIAIPTYNRADRLQAQLERLMPQLTAETLCCVYDNASTDETCAMVQRIVSPQLVYARATENGGMCRNFLRCFEECQTKWLWVLSDDDPVSPTAIKELLALLENQTCDFIHTSIGGPSYAANTVVSDVESLFQHTSFTMLNWLSSGIYRVSSVQPLLRVFNDSMFTWCPHSVVILSLVESRGGKVLLSNVNLIGGEGGAVGWSALDCLIRISLIPEYMAQPRNQKILAQSIMHEWYFSGLFMGLRELRTPVDIQKWKRIFRQASANLKSYNAQGAFLYFLHHWHRRGSRKRAFVHVFYALMLRALAACPPSFFHSLVRVLPLPGEARKAYQARNEFKARA